MSRTRFLTETHHTSIYPRYSLDSPNQALFLITSHLIKSHTPSLLRYNDPPKPVPLGHVYISRYIANTHVPQADQLASHAPLLRILIASEPFNARIDADRSLWLTAPSVQSFFQTASPRTSYTQSRFKRVPAFDLGAGFPPWEPKTRGAEEPHHRMFPAAAWLRLS